MLFVQEHNAEARAVWEAFHAGHPIRPPVMVVTGTQFFIFDGSPEDVKAETERILNSGVCEGGRFLLREANNLAPRTPSANLAAMYETARAWSYPA